MRRAVTPQIYPISPSRWLCALDLGYHFLVFCAACLLVMPWWLKVPLFCWIVGSMLYVCMTFAKPALFIGYRRNSTWYVATTVCLVPGRHHLVEQDISIVKIRRHLWGSACLDYLFGDKIYVMRLAWDSFPAGQYCHFLQAIRWVRPNLRDFQFVRTAWTSPA